MAKIQRSNIVETEDMIGMTMSDEDGIEMLQTESQSLLAKVAGGIDYNRLTGMFDEH